MEKELLDVQKRDASSPVETERTRTRRVYVPKVDIYETAEAIVVLADMPGVDDRSVDVTLEKNVLTLTGAVFAAPPEGYAPAYAEYDTGDYQRAFTLSDEVDRDRIEASVRNGVLRIVLHKLDRVKVRKIEVHTA